MNAQLQWIAAPSASLTHAAVMQAKGLALVDGDLARRIAPIIAATDVELQAADVDRAPFWANLVPASASASPFLARDLAGRLIEKIGAIETPITSKELLLRAARCAKHGKRAAQGSGDRFAASRAKRCAAPAASVILVRPALGGGGAAFPEAKAVSFEAMLANPQRELPEIVRLAWLLAQIELGCDTALSACSAGACRGGRC